MSSIGTPKQWWNTLTHPNTWLSTKPYDEWNQEMTAYVDQDEQAEKDRKAAEDAKAAAQAKEEADLAAAAAAEADALKKRKGMKATMLTDVNQDQLGSAPTQKAQMLG
jgi:ATPase subunit of ABC transporter with duplicated ATPase domains